MQKALGTASFSAERWPLRIGPHCTHLPGAWKQLISIGRGTSVRLESRNIGCVFFICTSKSFHLCFVLIFFYFGCKVPKADKRIFLAFPYNLILPSLLLPSSTYCSPGLSISLRVISQRYWLRWPGVDQSNTRFWGLWVCDTCSMSGLNQVRQKWSHSVDSFPNFN